jgi:hypothetical protein
MAQPGSTASRPAGSAFPSDNHTVRVELPDSPMVTAIRSFDGQPMAQHPWVMMHAGIRFERRPSTPLRTFGPAYEPGARPRGSSSVQLLARPSANRRRKKLSSVKPLTRFFGQCVHLNKMPLLDAESDPPWISFGKPATLRRSEIRAGRGTTPRASPPSTQGGRSCPRLLILPRRS